jgi:RHS repeat-associated protein
MRYLGTIAKIDPTLLANDSYNLRLTAVDNGGNSSSTQNTISVAGELKLGNFQLSFTDITLPVSGIPISVTRTYDTLTSNTKDDFGYGWRLEWRDTNLKTSLGTDDQLNTFGIPSRGFRTGDKVYITLPGGKRETYTFNPELDRLGGFLLDQNGNGGLWHPKFISSAGSTNTLSTLDLLLTKNQNGDFVGIGNGNYYNPAQAYFGSSYTLTAKTGIVYQIDAVSGDLNTITDTNGNILTFSEAGIKSNSGVEVKFARDAMGRIVKVIDPMGNEIGYEYDSQGDLIGVTDREGNETQFEYNNTRAHYLDKILDPLGREAVKTEYDSNGRLKRTLNAGGNGIEFIYNPENSLQTVKDALGNETTYEYDSRGNVVAEIDAVGKITKRTYDSNNYQLTETIISDRSNSNGFTTTYTYDSRGNKLTETDALGNTTRYTYSDRSRLLSTTDPLGRTTSNTYDSRGNLIATKDALGNTIRFNYDNRGQVNQTIDAIGNITKYEYDNNGNIAKMTDPLGYSTSYTYNNRSDKLIETKTVTTAKGIQTAVTTYTYDDNGRTKSTTDALGQTTTYEYDKRGLQTLITDPLGRKTQYIYDDNGQLIETIYPDNTPNDSTDNPRIQTRYDIQGREIASIDEAGRIAQNIYNAVGRIIETIYPDNTPNDSTDNPRTKTEYYSDGNVKASINERGNRTEYRYDAAGRQTEIIYPDATPENSSDNSKTRYQYNQAGQQINLTDALNRSTRYEYDDLGRMVKTIYADNTFTTSNYDTLGRRIATTDQNGTITEYRYDLLGKLTGVKNALGDWTKYSYSLEGSLLGITDANNNTTSYEYDILGHRVATILPLGQRSSSSYDAVGNISSITDFNGRTTVFTYDAQNRLKTKLFQDGNKVTYGYTINSLLDVTTIFDSNGQMTAIYDRDYDEQNRLVKHTDTINGVSLSVLHAYDIAGNRTSVSTPTNTTYYTYDERNRLKTVTDNASGVTTYEYDANNNLIHTTFANGVVETRAYDALNRLVDLVNKNNNGTIINSYQHTLDKAGNRLKITELNGRTIDYSYDPLYRLINEKVADSVNGDRLTNFTYDKVGNRLTQTENYVTTVYSYDNNDRLLSERINGQTVITYTYDNNGSTLTKNELNKLTQYTWNDDKRLVEVNITDSNGTQQLIYQYDDNGIRVISIVNGVITRYLLDIVQAFAQVLSEYQNNNSTPNVNYVYGHDLISQAKASNSNYYLVDGLGSTRMLTDSQGYVTDTYNYEVFGELLNSSNSTKNSYLFAGEQFDTALGNYYLRDRFYDAGSGRFTRRDNYQGEITNPLTLHKYIYTHNNPVNGTDPTGLFFLAEVQGAESIRNILAGMQMDVGGHLVAATLNQGDYDLDDIIKGAATGLGIASAAPLLLTLAPKLKLNTIVGIGQEKAGLRLPPNLRVNPRYPGPPTFAIGRQPRNMNCVNCAVTIDNILGGSGAQLAIPNKHGASLLEIEEIYNNQFFDVSSAELELLLQSTGAGTRGIVYGERGPGQGHVFNAINLSGEVLFIDGQSGRYTDLANFSNLAFLKTN